MRQQRDAEGKRVDQVVRVEVGPRIGDAGFEAADRVGWVEPRAGGIPVKLLDDNSSLNPAVKNADLLTLGESGVNAARSLFHSLQT